MHYVGTPLAIQQPLGEGRGRVAPFPVGGPDAFFSSLGAFGAALAETHPAGGGVTQQKHPQRRHRGDLREGRPFPSYSEEIEQ